jgi:hypothetical protein
MFSFSQSVVAGFATNCPESAATVLADLKEIGPTYFFAPPRIWENILTAVMIRVDDAWGPKRAMIRFFLDVARRTERARLAHRAPALGDRLLYALGGCWCTAPCATTWGCGASAWPIPPGGHRAGALRVLPLPRDQREAALRDDGVERPHLHPAGQ